MMNNDNEKIRQNVQQFVVHFACRTPIRRELNTSLRRSLPEKLNEMDPELFQLVDETPSKDSPCLFRTSQQYNIDALSITGPTLIITTDSISIIKLVKVGNFVLTSDKSLDTNEWNKKMVDYLIKISGILGTRISRAGKIFEITLRMINKEEKNKIFKNIFSVPIDDIGEIDLAFTKYKNYEKIYNIQTRLKFLQHKLDDPFPVTVRIDINNRNLAQSLEPRDIASIYKKADVIIWEHLNSLFSF